MRLRRIRVEQLRQFREPLEIGDLSAGINLFAGPNESGKSTLVQAIRAAFFERFKSSSAEDLQPWEDSSAAPSVEIDFDWQGERWELSKRFLKRKRCDLNIAGRRFTGEEAEEKLAELLGYQFPGRGASKAEHWGIPGLLWIEQGAGHEIQEPVAHAGDYLKSALGESLGEVASSAGDALIARVAQERAALLTATGRPTGAYAAVIQEHAESGQRLQALDEDIQRYRQQVDHLGELRARQQDDAARPWEDYRRQAREAEARLAEVQGWEQARQAEQQELRHVRDTLALGRQRLEALASQGAELAQRAEARQAAIAALASQEALGPGIQAGLERARAAYRAADQALRQARQREHRTRLAQESKRLEGELADLDRRLAETRTLQTRVQAERQQLQANRVDAAALKPLQALGQALGRIQAAQQSIATRLQFRLLPGQQVQLGGEALRGEGDRLLVDPSDLDIPGVGTLRVLPGGENLADLGRRRQAAEDALAMGLKALRAESLAHAETLAEQHRTLQLQLRQSEVLLRNLAPEGVDELSSRRALAAERQAELLHQLAQLPDAAPTDTTLESAEHGLEDARQQLHAAEQQLGAFKTDLSLAGQAVASAEAEWRKQQAVLQAPERQAQTAQLESQLSALQARDGALQDSLARRQQAIDAARPDILRQDIERYTRSAEALEGEARQRSLEQVGLQSRLEALGAHGLEERRAELDLQFQQLGRRRDELQQRAAALDLLLELLQSRRQALARRIQAPLQAHLDRYLQLLFPRSRLSVDDELRPTRLARTEAGRETHDAYSALSFGAREQMGLISRLAYADLLKEAGRPTLIILDDALVHSDPVRLAQMKRVLFDAAQRHQVLLFTCHPDNWKDLGVTARAMEALKRGG